ncbi:TonB-dependent receptor [Sphingobacterium endophyticum]|uniref:TonB-dependent receptor n=1 Tax=Sphingobacterium endophyticum TaxID=2546448 RepID=UPI0012E0F2A4|nr:TonB-dependent receptor [Sphingobacterium endophyticum]
MSKNKVALITIASILSLINSQAQEVNTDTSINEIVPIEIKAHFNSQSMLDLTSAAKVVTKKLLESQAPNSFLGAINTTTGLRMEERSPGSYRLALRGSMLRSPFGVRNTKIYLDEIPFTDASGNTYLNILDPVGVNAIQILKGPDGSLFGPNSGGVIRFIPEGFGPINNEKSLMLSSGSFGLFHEQLQINHQVNENYSFSFDQAYLRSDGYRQHTAMDKLFFQTAHQWKYNQQGKLKFFGLYADLGYQTPGALTQLQYDEDPTQARPAGGPFPSAKDQKAAIYNKTWIGGITNEYQLNKNLKHVISIFGSSTDIENPFITNYELRDEKNIGLRTYLSYENQEKENFLWEMQLGAEAQKGWYHVKNHENDLGVMGTLTDDDNLENGQHFYFYRLKTRLYHRLTAEGSIGLNFNTINFKRNIPDEGQVNGKIDFNNAWMPRVGLSYAALNNLSIRASISKGYSTPTIAEVRSSDNKINQDLQAETGINYEAGIRYESKNRRFIADLSAYNYQMDNGIIRQLNESGSEYFVNAGKIDQKGIEANILTQLISSEYSNFLKGLILSSNLTYQDYKFKDYVIGDNNFNGNKVTSVPNWIWANTLSFKFVKNIDINLLHNFTSSISLNDANTVNADKYHILQAKVSWLTPITNKYNLQIFAGADNLLNEKYSLGNDINAMGNRYFNAAPTRNFYAGIKVIL